MNNNFYSDIFKRKSFHLFKNVGNDRITQSELDGIVKAYDEFECLYPDIKTAVRIVPAAKINFKRDAEYCVLIYSEKKDNYLMNAGFIGQQLDLYPVHNNIGSLWYGLGKPDIANYNGLDFVIMFAIRKVNNNDLYRKDMFKAKRKDLKEIWQGDTLGVAEIARFAPSACNSQPWFVKNENGKLTVYRYKKSAKIGILTPNAAAYFNRIDIGIFLCILEICMAEKQLKFTKTLFSDFADGEYSKVLVCFFNFLHIY